MGARIQRNGESVLRYMLKLFVVWTLVMQPVMLPALNININLVRSAGLRTSSSFILLEIKRELFACACARERKTEREREGGEGGRAARENEESFSVEVVNLAEANYRRVVRGRNSACCNTFYYFVLVPPLKDHPLHLRDMCKIDH